MDERTSVSKKLLVSAFFLAVYCNVLFTQFVCTYVHLSELIEEDYQHHHDGLAIFDHEGSHEHGSSEDNDCCKDSTRTFFASQANPTDFFLQFRGANTFFAKFVDFSCNVPINGNPSINSKVFFYYELPPPKIPDIRVFLHSFLV